MAQPPIADYALLGDTRTAALVSGEGSVDWMCAPRFDSPPVFASLVDAEHGGAFAISVDGATRTRRRYLDASAVLETVWATPHGEVTVTDAMVPNVLGDLLPRSLLIRRVVARGDATIRVRFDPRHGLPGSAPRRWRYRGGELVCDWGPLAVSFQSWPRTVTAPGRDASVELADGDRATFAVGIADREPAVLLTEAAATDLIERTETHWREWAGQCSYDGPFADAVLRSLITLRLLTYAPTGAPVAAPTTSLPEELGSGRNWDYRYSWPRDASIGLAAFLAAGMPAEAHAFMHWLRHASRLSRPRLDVLYTIHGRRLRREREVPEVSGYRASRPVRTGNLASEQHQLDVYGWVLDAAWLLHSAGERLAPATWRALAAFADFVAANWHRPDAGIWEVRGKTRQHVHSKLMAWLALDRAIRLAAAFPVRQSRVARWTAACGQLANELLRRGLDDEGAAYVRAYGAADRDAALLLLPVLEFDRDDERVRATIDAIRDQLGAGGPLVYRYSPGSDGLPGSEGAFLPCSFWLVQALARTGRVATAKRLFASLLNRANDVGLFAEELDPQTGTHLGNFPQALTHAALIQAAMALHAASAAAKRPPAAPRRSRARRASPRASTFRS
ncbi:MAG: glycoside hydrolase family 15 protein [Mycobacteriales bacterium]